jgi:hypothetical protein
VGSAVPAAAQMPGGSCRRPSLSAAQVRAKATKRGVGVRSQAGAHCAGRSAGALPAARGRGRISPIQAASGEYDEGLWERQANGGIW